MHLLGKFLRATALVALGAVLAVVLIASGYGDGSVRRLQRLLGEAAAPSAASGWVALPSALHAIEWRVVPLTDEARTGGALTVLPAVGIVAATAQGEFYGLADGGSPARLDIPSPLNAGELDGHAVSALPTFHRQYFRVNDILLAESAAGDGTFDLYATHHHFDPARGCVQWRLSALTVGLANGRPAAIDAAWRPLVIANPCVPVETSANPTYYAFNGDVSGGRMVLLDAETLLVSVGDFQLYEKSGRSLAQDAGSELGKILRVERATGRHSIVASGVRNPQGLWRDAQGRVWETEHGPRGGDELNLIHAGADYGWPGATYGVHYDLRPWRAGAREGRHDTGVTPALAFVPSLGVSVVIDVDGGQFPNWDGDLLIGTLSTQKLVRVRLDGDRPVYAETISLAGYRIRDLDRLPDGTIVALSHRMEIVYLHNAAGAGSRALTPDAGAALDLAALTNGLPQSRAALVRAGADAYKAHCMKCHGLGAAVATAPSLHGVIGREIASLPGFAYSPALSGVGGRWTEAALQSFLVDPGAFAPGQAMPEPDLDPAQREAVAAFLARYRRTDAGPHTTRSPGD